MARQWIKEHEKYAIVKIAEGAGHKVLFTPPYHSDLQPIELVWAALCVLVTQKWISKNEIKVLAMEIMFFNLVDVKRKRKERSNRAIDCRNIVAQYFEPLTTLGTYGTFANPLTSHFGWLQGALVISMIPKV